MTIIAVHIGAGFHSFLNEDSYRELIRAVLLHRVEKDDILDIISSVTEQLENDPMTNAGVGSNLTNEGKVEMDATVACCDGRLGSIAAISNVKNPISVAARIANDSLKNTPLLSPVLMVGEGAALKYGIPRCPLEELITAKSLKSYKKYKSDDLFMDTVGTIVLHKQKIAVSVSSGGIALKWSGRIGEAAIYGAGCYLYSRENVNIGVSVSGAGEQMQRMLFAKALVDKCKNKDFLKDPLDSIMNEFWSTLSLSSYEQRNVGFILLKSNRQNERECVELWYGHTTPSFGFGFVNKATNQVEYKISRLKQGGNWTIGCYPM